MDVEVTSGFEEVRLRGAATAANTLRLTKWSDIASFFHSYRINFTWSMLQDSKYTSRVRGKVAFSQAPRRSMAALVGPIIRRGWGITTGFP